MKACLVKFILFLLLADLSYSAQLLPFREAKRVKRIQKILKVLENTDSKLFKKDLAWARLLNSRICDTELLSVKVSCLVEQSKRACKKRKENERRSCLLHMDLIIVNVLNESMFISNREKYKMLKDAFIDDNIFNKNLEHRYGELATSFAMSKYFVCSLHRPSCFGAGLDSFCREFSDTGRLPYQACLGALLSFIATNLE